MTTKQADKLIAEKKEVALHNTFYNETFVVKIVRRDRFNLYGSNGEVFDRASLVIVNL